jgi:hypothetical protein
LERFDAGKDAAKEAVMVCRRLAAKQPDDYQANLAYALSCLSQQFRGLNAHTEQRAALAESAEIHRRLAAGGSEAARLELIDALTDLASACEAGRDPDAALESLREATTVLRELVRDDLAYEWDLARTVGDFCRVLDKQGRHQEELTARAEALDIYERLVEVRTDCDQEFANALLAQARAYGRVNQHRESARVCTRLLALFNSLAAQGTGGMEPYIAATLQSRSEQLAALENYDESLADIETAARILRELAATDPTARLQLAYALQIATRQYLRSGGAAQALRARDELRELAGDANQPVVTAVYTAICREMPAP